MIGIDLGNQQRDERIHAVAAGIADHEMPRLREGRLDVLGGVGIEAENIRCGPRPACTHRRAPHEDRPASAMTTARTPHQRRTCLPTAHWR